MGDWNSSPALPDLRLSQPDPNKNHGVRCLFRFLDVSVCSSLKYPNANFFNLGIYRYFRIWLNIRILYSVLTEYDMMPYVPSPVKSTGSPTEFPCFAFSDSSKRWAPADGVWMLWWMKYQIFVPLLLLLFLNLFWYYIMIRVARRYVLTLNDSLHQHDLPFHTHSAIKEGNTTDERSDDEDDGKGNWSLGVIPADLDTHDTYNCSSS